MNKKIISIIFIIALFFVLSLFNNVYASDFEFNAVAWDDDVLNAFKQISEYENIDDYWYNMNFNGNTYPLLLIPKADYPDLKIYFDGFSKTTSSGLSDYTFRFNISSKIVSDYYLYDKDTKQFVSKGSGTHLNYFYHCTNSGTNDFPILSNITWYTDNTYETVFFFPGIVAQKVQLVKETLPQTMKEIVGLLPMILVLLVFLLGLTKGLRIIKNLIQSA